MFELLSTKVTINQYAAMVLIWPKNAIFVAVIAWKTSSFVIELFLFFPLFWSKGTKGSTLHFIVPNVQLFVSFTNETCFPYLFNSLYCVSSKKEIIFTYRKTSSVNVSNSLSGKTAIAFEAKFLGV